MGNKTTNISDIKVCGLKEKAKKSEKTTKELFKKLKKCNSNVDKLFNDLHYRIFEQFDCLVCANCCKTISPILLSADIERIAKYLKIKPSVFYEQYVTTDSEKDFVFKQVPCPFLADDNYCIIYNNRPKACREYPHTNRRNMRQILNLTLKNTFVCPVVFQIVQRIKPKFNY